LSDKGGNGQTLAAVRFGFFNHAECRERGEGESASSGRRFFQCVEAAFRRFSGLALPARVRMRLRAPPRYFACRLGPLKGPIIIMAENTAPDLGPSVMERPEEHVDV
jgi:hypothetical protein